MPTVPSDADEEAARLASERWKAQVEELKVLARLRDLSKPGGFDG
jgi:hypothetical protein